MSKKARNKKATDRWEWRDLDRYLFEPKFLKGNRNYLRQPPPLRIFSIFNFPIKD